MTNTDRNGDTAVTTLYDGKLTAWASIEITKVLEKVLPPVEKLHEPNLLTTVKNPKINPAHDRLLAIMRQYAAKQSSSKYEKPVEVRGGISHVSEDDV